MAVKHPFFTNPDFASITRQKIFKYVVLFTASVFIIRLGYLQIIKGGMYRSESETQAIKETVVEPFRGNMYDRYGDLMVHNEPSFSVTLTMNEFSRDRLPLLASILKTDTTEILKVLDRNKNFSQFQGIKIARDIDFQTLSLIEEYSDLLKGIEVVNESKRLYNFDCNMAHFLGYTREINQAQMEKMTYYKPGDVLGQSGLEYSYDNFLRGQKGINFVAVTRNGEKIAHFNSGLNDVPVSNGFDLYLTIDKKLQEKGEELMKDQRGAIVAIDPNNGEVLAMVSKPDYDPRKFSGKVPADIYNALMDDPGKPLYNRALQSAYPPGSTWKMLVAIAALSEGVITENTTISCPGSFTYGNRSYECHGAHGLVNVKKAIQASCNVFFYQAALKLGIERLSKYEELFGFCDRTHIDIPNEGRGVMPTIDWLIKRYGKDKWPKGNIINYGIGQGEINVTPLQMAVYTATLANGGTIYQPHIVRSVNNNLLHKTQKMDYGSKKLNLNPHIVDVAREGMFMCVNVPGGTGYGAKIEGVLVAGKTGTAQNPHGNNHSWFVCFAPYDHPKIAMAIIVENAGFGAAVALPMAKTIMEQYLSRNGIGKPPAPLQKKDTSKVVAMKR